MNMKKTCGVCSKKFMARSNKIYCSSRCRRQKENERRTWDKRAQAPGYCEMNAASEYLNEEQKKHWIDLAQKYRNELGERP